MKQLKWLANGKNKQLLFVYAKRPLCKIKIKEGERKNTLKVHEFWLETYNQFYFLFYQFVRYKYPLGFYFH